jgi:heme/copper-type cytochrome/quinol oxidase subunit 1
MSENASAWGIFIVVLAACMERTYKFQVAIKVDALSGWDIINYCPVDNLLATPSDLGLPMPAQTRWFLHSSLVYLILAMVLGILNAAQAPLNLPAQINAFSPIYFHLFMVGWVTQLIFGVVFWMFPKHSKEQPRGNESLGWATFWLLNVGLLLRLVGEPAQVLLTNPIWGWVVGLSAVLQWMAGMIFVINTWGRVKER